ncbi:hypothetical protein [Nocardia sp. 348MFTsu5.1]|uniref:hypothetical protein n=1 Tax=Nocardia sp. 348MFTsu5.1 TaxID=1172185 RepID=UPI0003654BB7|nr:hypothetical protein [Nocardia sp. 348MFTsu5.1]
MNLYDYSVELDLRLKSMQVEDSNIDLVAKADNLVDAVDAASSCFASIELFMSRMSSTSSPSVDVKSATAAVRAFRAGVSRHGPKAFQQQPAAKLVDAAKDQRKRSMGWAAAVWTSLIDEYQPLLDSAQPGRLIGDSVNRRTAERVATKIGMLRRQNPVTDEAKIVKDLCGGDVQASWRGHLSVLADELGRALDLLKEERDALTPEVQSVLRIASSADGFSLELLTADVLEKLLVSGVAGDLVVRRR